LDIRKKTNTLKKKYGTNDPFDIAKYLGIKVIFEPLGSISGYYNKQLRMKQIHINHDLSDHDQLFTCAHELGHAIMHPDANTPFLRKRTGLLVSKMEIEADKFATELLIDDEVFLEFQEFTTDQIARALGYNEELIKLRLK
jgi:Zn-dependent peptidase ImmA (M78 family)